MRPIESLHGLIQGLNDAVRQDCETALTSAHFEMRRAARGLQNRDGNRWENAVMERVWQNGYVNHAVATNDIANYIVNFYNSQRLHSKLGHLPPNAFEQKSAIEQPIGLCNET